MLRLTDTIAAVATPPGEGGVGIVRVSGPEAISIAGRLFRTRAGDPGTFRTHTVHYGRIVEPADGATVDDALLLLFRKPHSYTGEDVIEFSCHGGPVTLARVLRLALDAGSRYAEPGEFTQRAFLNGRMDLTQAEAVCDLIRARTDSQRRLAVVQREGALSKRVSALRDALTGALASVEVTIDFSDEVGDLDYCALSERLSKLVGELQELIREGEHGRVYREGVRLAIVGRPNVGKSSLMNALLRQERAIVTPVAGTTRDTIEETANIRGIPITAIDTAGLRDTEDVVERIGVERARAAIDSASLLLFVVDCERGWSDEDAAIWRQIRERPVVAVLNKSDLAPHQRREQTLEQVRDAVATEWIPISATSGEGLGEVENRIAETVLGGAAGVEGLAVTNARHLHELGNALTSLELARATTAQGLPPDFISIDLRGALDALGRITGETATEEIIHRIFHDFCVGK